MQTGVDVSCICLLWLLSEEKKKRKKKLSEDWCGWALFFPFLVVCAEMLPESVVLMLVDPTLSPKRTYNLLPLLLTAMIYKNISDFGLSMPKTAWLTQEDRVYSLREATAVGCPKERNGDKTQTSGDRAWEQASEINYWWCESFLFQVNFIASGPLILG